MKIKKLFAAVAAVAVGATMMATSAFAAGTFTFKATGSDWSDATSPITAEDTSITVTWEAPQASIVNPGYVAYDEQGDTAEISRYLTSMTVNGEYEIPVGYTLSLPEVEGSAGLPNIWNDLGKADVVFEGDGCGLYGDGGTSITFKVDGTATEITSITYNFGEAQADEPADEPTDEPTDEPADDNVQTGAEAGLALAGIALAAAAIVATKKK